MLNRLVKFFKKETASAASAPPSNDAAPVADEQSGEASLEPIILPFPELKFASWIPEVIEGEDRLFFERFINSQIPPATPRRRFNAHMDPNGNTFLLIRATDEAGKIVGAIAFQPQTPIKGGGFDVGYHIEFNYIAVAESYRGRGLAKFLMAQAILFAIGFTRKSPKAVNGICKPDQAGFYGKLGFEVSEPRRPIPRGVLPMGFVPAIDGHYPCSFWKKFENIGDLDLVLKHDPRLFLVEALDSP